MSYTQVNFTELLDLKAHKRFWNYLQRSSLGKLWDISMGQCKKDVTPVR